MYYMLAIQILGLNFVAAIKPDFYFASCYGKK